MTIELLDPAAADNFRMTKDYGRWYIDPLPACDIAPATDAQWPSCSAVKKASEKDWSFLVAPRLAALDKAELYRIGDLDRQQRLDAFKSHENQAKNLAFGRGSIVHLWKEDLLAGREPRVITEQWLAANKYPVAAVEEATAYLPAIRDFFDVYQPEPVVVEYVTIHRTLNGHGYGATPDALIKIEGETVAVDWKTRSDGSNHAAYAEELAQVACGVHAEYMIVTEGGEARRAPLPAVSGGYVVSIKTDGARLYPLDLDKGWAHWCRLHEWWVARLTEKDGVGRVLPARRKIAAPVAALTVEQPATVAVEDAATVAPSRKDELVARFEKLTHDQKADFKSRRMRKGDLDAVERALDSITNTSSRPAEGPDVDEATWAPVVAAGEALPVAAKQWCKRLFHQASDANVPFHRASAPTLRRYEIYRGIIRLVQWEGTTDGLILSLASAANLEDLAHLTPGAALGTLDYQFAADFARLVDELVAPPLAS